MEMEEAVQNFNGGQNQTFELENLKAWVDQQKNSVGLLERTKISCFWKRWRASILEWCSSDHSGLVKFWSELRYNGQNAIVINSQHVGEYACPKSLS